MKNRKRLLGLMVLLSWITIPFIGSKSIRRFIPASLLVSLVLMIEGYIAKKRKWWSFQTKINPNVNGELPFIVGPFLAASLWILKYTYGKFTQYTLLNAVFNLIFAYPGTWLLKKLKISSLERLKPFSFFLLMYKNAFIMYGFQKLLEKKIGYASPRKDL
ncbi:hypothetical protein [Salipaludibacillus sp. CF4.18]|uniref:hypothetical protein n=1 Tax=Salipaludibacillus sp. CF4.18 TaxID=3373081 RepID=UPI003EE6605D